MGLAIDDLVPVMRTVVVSKIQPDSKVQIDREIITNIHLSISAGRRRSIINCCRPGWKLRWWRKGLNDNIEGGGAGLNPRVSKRFQGFLFACPGNTAWERYAGQ